MYLIDLERIILVITIILSVFFTLIGIYLQSVLGYTVGLKNKKLNECNICARDIKFDWKFYGKMLNTFKVDLPKALIIGCYFISAVFIANALFSITDLFLSMPLLNKIFLYAISIYVFLTITHFIILFKQINTCINKPCGGNADKAKNHFAFSISPEIITHLNTSTTVLLGVCGGIVLMMVLPTYMAKSKNLRRK